MTAPFIGARSRRATGPADSPRLRARVFAAALAMPLPSQAATLLLVRGDLLGPLTSIDSTTAAQGFVLDPNRLTGACAAVQDAGLVVWRSSDDSCARWEDADAGTLPDFDAPVRGAVGLRLAQVLSQGRIVLWDTALAIACLPGACDEAAVEGEPPDPLHGDGFED